MSSASVTTAGENRVRVGELEGDKRPQRLETPGEVLMERVYTATCGEGRRGLLRIRAVLARSFAKMRE